MDGYEYRVTRRVLEDELFRTKINLKHLEIGRSRQKKHILFGILVVLFLNLFAGVLGSFSAFSYLAEAFFIVPNVFFRVVSGIVALWCLVQIVRFLGDSGNALCASFFGGKRTSYVVMKQEYLEKIQQLEQNLYELKKKNLEEVLYDKK